MMSLYVINTALYWIYCFNTVSYHSNGTLNNVETLLIEFYGSKNIEWPKPHCLIAVNSEII